MQRWDEDHIEKRASRELRIKPIRIKEKSGEEVEIVKVVSIIIMLLFFNILFIYQNANIFYSDHIVQECTSRFASSNTSCLISITARKAKDQSSCNISFAARHFMKCSPQIFVDMS